MKTILVILLSISFLPPATAKPVQVQQLVVGDKFVLSSDATKPVVVTSETGAIYALRLRNGKYKLAAINVPSAEITERMPDMLPDGIVSAGMANLKRVWLSAPTRRYDHGILGDVIEASAVSAELAGGQIVVYQLPDEAVFEDLKARLVDLDGNGQQQILVVRSWLDRGAAPVILSVENGSLGLTASAAPIGRSHRWLNPVGVADFDGDGIPEIAAIVTPHIGGTLQLYHRVGDRLITGLSASGFSNHRIGSRNLDLSAIADINGDGVADIVSPDASHRNLLAVTFRDGQYREIFRVPLTEAIMSAILVTDFDQNGRPELVMATDRGTLLVLTPAP